MFTLELFDRNGEKLQQGNIVKVSDGRNFKFYSEVKWLEQEQVIAPFHTFSFHSFVKVDKLPENLQLSTQETRYSIWWTVGEEMDEAAEKGETYLKQWRGIEEYINNGIYKIKPL